jgi:putative peptidoglycan lipid II flippase
MLGGFAALAESAWMGIALAWEFLEPARLAGARLRTSPPHIPRLRLAGLLTREMTITEATVVLMASFFISAVLGAVRQVLFNAQFGAGVEANAYYAAFRLPDTLFSLIAGGALSSAMIPVLLSTVNAEGETAEWRLVSRVLTALLGSVALLVLIAELFAPLFVSHFLAPGFDPATSRLTANLTRIMLVQPVILVVGSVATAVLNSRNRFAITALSVASHNASLIAGIFAARFYPSLGIYGPTLGVVGGAVLQTIILLPGLRGHGLRFRPAWNWGDPRLREVVRLLIPNGLAVGVGYAGFILDTAFASQAPQLAGLPAIQNAWLLVGLPIALLGQAVGQSAFPRIAAQAASRDWRRLRRTVIGALGAAMVLAVPALLGLIFLGRPIIRILFEHGKFDAAAGALTYGVLTVYAVALPAYVGTEVVTRGLIALRDTRTPLLTNSAQVGGRAVLMALLLGRVGVVAIPLAFGVMASLETILLAMVLLLKLQWQMRAHPGASDTIVGAP